MSSQSPFIDPKTGGLDVDVLLSEAVPIAKLVAVVAVVALVPVLLTRVVSGLLGLRWAAAASALLTQFVLAVGTGVVLLYVVTRAIELSDR